MRILIPLIFMLTSMELTSQTCLSEYNYYRNIVIQPGADEQSEGEVVVAIPFNSKALVDSGKLLSDGEDMQVTNSACQPLPFFIQGVDIYEANVLYVKLPSLTSAGYTIKVHYGNKQITKTAIDGKSVFSFFDDFEDGIVDRDKWETVGQFTQLEEKNGKLLFTGKSGHGGIFLYITPKVSYTSPITIDFAANSGNSQFYGIANSVGLNRIGFRYESGAFSKDTLDIVATLTDTVDGGSGEGKKYPFVKVPRSVQNIISITAYVDSDKKVNVTHFKNMSNGLENRTVYKNNFLQFDAIRPFFSSFISAAIVDFVGIRPASQMNPQFNFEEEVSLSTGINEVAGLKPSIKIFPNPSSEQITFDWQKTQPVAISILNILGQQIQHQSFTKQLNISHLTTGNYLIQFHYPDNSVLTRLIRKVD
jgi:hypothetical protein